MKVSKLKPNPNNPRQIKDDRFKKLVKSIEEFPKMMNLRPIVYDPETMEVLGGNMRLKAIRELGFKEIPDTWIKSAAELTEDERRRFVIADNVEMGEYDWDVLESEWEDLPLTDWGLDLPTEWGDEVEAIEDNYEIPDEIETDIVLGDLITIGEHRLLCGDSTESDQVARLMGGEKADMVFTDPPYGIGYEYNDHKDVQGDEYLDFCDKWFTILQNLCEFIIISTGWKYMKYWWNKDPKDMMYWLARNKQTGGTVFHFRRIEPLFVWGKPNEKYNFDFFEEITDREDGLRDLHTCPKPIKLISDIIKGTKKDSNILDIFLGSGTTMVAAHQLNRKCYGMELDPKYCQVIVDRMKKLDPELKITKNGKPYKQSTKELVQ